MMRRAMIREIGSGAGSETGGRTRTAYQSPIGTQPIQKCCWAMGALGCGSGIRCPAIAIGSGPSIPSCAAAGMAGAPNASMRARINRNSIDRP